MSFFATLQLARQERRKSSGRAAREAFWTWFQDNKAFLETYAANTQEVVTAIGNHLDAVNPQLAFEMGQAADGIYEFIVSADGVRDVFPYVVALTEAAPTIPGWRIIAFRPRKPDSLGNVVWFGGMELGTSAVWYRSSSHEDRLDLALSVAGQDKDGTQEMLGALFLLLDATLGEYDVATRIGCIEFEDCPSEPAAAGFKPLSELAGEVDARFATAPA